MEITTLESNNTWSLVPFPIGKKIIGCKWVFRVKHKADGSIECFKDRLVDGRQGLHTTIWSWLWRNFFPCGKNDHLEMLDCFGSPQALGFGIVGCKQCLLSRGFALVSLHEGSWRCQSFRRTCLQASKVFTWVKVSLLPMVWMIGWRIDGLGFIQCKNDYSLFFRNNGALITFDAVYVDDIFYH